MNRLTYILLSVVLLCTTLSASSQIYDADGLYVDTIFHDHVNRQAEDFVIVSLCVADPTTWQQDMLGTNGHAWLRLQCPVFDLDNSFSYECESAEDNLWKYFKKDLKMGLFCYSTESQMAVYRKWNRTIHEYRLNLPPDAEQRLWEIMDNHVNNGVKLPMDMYKRGCAISLVHFVNEALEDTKIEYHEWPEEVLEKSRYQIIYDRYADYPWIRLAACWWALDKRFDAPCSNEEKLIMPDILVEAWSRATLNGEPFMIDQGELVSGKDVMPVSKTYFTPIVALVLFLLMIIGMVGLVIWRKRSKRLCQW